MSSHNLNDVQRVCDRVAMISDGSIIADGNIVDMIGELERNIEVKFGTSKIPDLSMIEGITNISLDQDIVHLRIKGPIKHLLQVLESETVEDLVIERPSLDSVFLSYYQTEEQ